MPERCLPCRYNEDGTRNYRYSDEGIDLLADVNLNINPLDINASDPKSAGKIIRRWNNFISFVRGKINIYETKFNSDSSVNNLQELLNNYNTNRAEDYKINSNIIKEAQTYHKLSDPSVVIDGRLGTQTFKLLYPDLIIYVKEEEKKDESGNKIWFNIDSPDKYIPVGWGDKKYVIKSSDFNKKYKNAINFYEFIDKYDPAKYPDEKMGAWKTNPSWNRLGLAYTPIPTPSPSEINLTTKKDQFKKEVNQKVTNILNSLKS